MKIAVEGDKAGGVVTSLKNFVKIEQKNIVVTGSPVASHGVGSHVAATMQSSIQNIKIEGIPIVVDGDSATCGDAIKASSFVEVK